MVSEPPSIENVRAPRRPPANAGEAGGPRDEPNADISFVDTSQGRSSGECPFAYLNHFVGGARPLPEGMCNRDGDCGEQEACACRTYRQRGGLCVKAECRVDADCGGGARCVLRDGRPGGPLSADRAPDVNPLAPLHRFVCRPAGGVLLVP